MITTGLLVLGTYGTYRSIKAFQTISERKQSLVIYRYQKNEDYLKYIQPKDYQKSFLLHLTPSDIIDHHDQKDSKHKLPFIGVLKVYSPKFLVSLLNHAAKEFKISHQSTDTSSNTILPLTPSFGIEMKNEWIESYVKYVNFNSGKENIIIPLKNFCPVLREEEVLEVIMTGYYRLMEEEYEKITSEKINFVNFSSTNILLKKLQLDYQTQGIFYYGKLIFEDDNNGRDVEQGYQNIKAIPPPSHSHHQSGEISSSSPSSKLSTRFIASHASTSKEALVNDIFHDEEVNASIALGGSIALLLLSPLLYKL